MSDRKSCNTSEVFREHEQQERWMNMSPPSILHVAPGDPNRMSESSPPTFLQTTPSQHLSPDSDPESFDSTNEDVAHHALLRQISFDYQLAPNQNVIQSLSLQSLNQIDYVSASEDSSINCEDSYEVPQDIIDHDPKSKIHPAEEELMILIRTNNLSPEFYEKISSWAKKYSDEGYKFKGRHYKTTMKHLMKMYGKEAGGETLHSTFVIENFPPIHVYRNQFLDHARRLFADAKLMEGALMKHNGERKVYSELNTGSWWKGCEESIAERIEPGCKTLPPNHYIAPVILFDDSTLLDNIGRLTAHPVLVSLGNICGKNRRSHTAWFLLGFIPPYPKTAEEQNKDKNVTATKQDHNIYYHRCLEHLLQDFKELTLNVNGVPMDVHGYGRVIIHFELSYIIGDTVGQDPMCGKNAGYGSNTARLVRDCDVSTEDGDDPHHKCRFNKVKTIKNQVEKCYTLWKEKKLNDTDATKEMRDISQLLFIPIYWDYPFGGDVSGVHGCLPIEILHAFLLGPMKELLQSLFTHTTVFPLFQTWYNKRCRNFATGATEDRPKYTGPKKRNILFRQSEFERRFRSVNRAACRQSDRSVPRCPFKHGVTTLTRLSGQEYPGLCLLTMVCLEGIINLEHDVARVLEKKYCYLLWMSLSLEVMLTKEEYSVTYLRDVEKKILYYLRCYREVCGPQREMQSKTGLRTTKFHSLKHFPYYIRKFGSPHNFSGTYLEAALKPYLKEQTKRTTRRHNRYLLDLMHRFHELMVVWTLQKHRDQRKSSPMLEKKSDDASDDFDYRLPKQPPFIMELGSDKKTWTTTTVIDCKRSRSKRLYHPKQDNTLGKSWLDSLILKVGKSGYNFVFCYYSCIIPSLGNPQDIFRCDPDYRSYPWNKRGWFDWAMVEIDGELVAARLRLWGNFKKNEGDEGDLYAVVQPLKTTRYGGNHHVFTWMKANYIADELICVEFDRIREVAYVLPTSKALPAECRTNKNQAAEKMAFPDDLRDHKYYIVIPPRVEWETSGWDKIIADWDPL